MKKILNKIKVFADSIFKKNEIQSVIVNMSKIKT